MCPTVKTSARPAAIWIAAVPLLVVSASGVVISANHCGGETHLGDLAQPVRVDRRPLAFAAEGAHQSREPRQRQAQARDRVQESRFWKRHRLAAES